MHSRREFIKHSCALCTAAIGFGIFLTAESCNTGTRVYHTAGKDGKLKIPLKVFRDKKMILVRTLALPFDLLLIRKSGTEITGLLMKCTHRGEPLGLKKNYIYCAAHGSAFDFDGHVLSAPAKEALQEFKTTIEGTDVLVSLKSQE